MSICLPWPKSALPPSSATTETSRLVQIGMLFLIVTGLLLRLARLDSIPHGFFVDEAAISAQVVCLRQTGSEIYGQHHPILAPVLAGGYVTPAYLYGGAVWTSTFGDSPAAFRAMVATYGILTVIGISLLAWLAFADFEVAVFAALAAALSPWQFQFSRIAWDPPLAICFSVWSLCFLFLMRAPGSKQRTALFAAIGGVLAGLAFYSYPPLRVQLPLVFGAYFILAWRARWFQQSKFNHVIFLLALALTIFPILQLILSGEIQGRFNAISIFNSAYLSSRGDPNSLSLVLHVFFENLFANFSPRFLFTAGDQNLRHSTGHVGMWSWMDSLGTLSALLACGFFYWHSSPRRPIRHGSKSRHVEIQILCFFILSYIAGVVPTALTWESNPHALRSIGAAPFLSLVAGWGLAKVAAKGQWASFCVLLVSCSFAAFYFSDYFTNYEARSAPWFDASESQYLEKMTMLPTSSDSLSGTNENQSSLALKQFAERYAPLAIEYYELKNGRVHCLK
jgi:hypothetical protein